MPRVGSSRATTAAGSPAPIPRPASTIAQTSLTSLFGSIMRRLPFISPWYATFMPIELSPGDEV